MDKIPNRIDVAESLRLRIQCGLTYLEIADRLGYAKSTVSARINRILTLLGDPQANRDYAESQANILQGTNLVLRGNILDPERPKKASVNNLAYAFQQIHNARRLEAGLSTDKVDVLAQYEILQEQ